MTEAISDTEIHPKNDNGSWLHWAISQNALHLSRLNPEPVATNRDGTVSGAGGPGETIYFLGQGHPGNHLAKNSQLLEQMPREIHDRFCEHKHREGKFVTCLISDRDTVFAGIGGIFIQGRATLFMGTVADREGRLSYVYLPFPKTVSETGQDQLKFSVAPEQSNGLIRIEVPIEEEDFLKITIEELKN